jgi:hypothetical protein
MRFLVIDGDKIYNSSSNIVAFITGALLQLGVKEDTELKRLGDTIEDIYSKVQHIDLSDILDYVYYNSDKIGVFTRQDWVDKIVEAQW